jgi:hypothetical protein
MSCAPSHKQLHHVTIKMLTDVDLNNMTKLGDRKSHPLAWLVPLLEVCLCLKAFTCIVVSLLLSDERIRSFCDMALAVNWTLVLLVILCQIGRWYYWKWMASGYFHAWFSAIGTLESMVAQSLPCQNGWRLLPTGAWLERCAGIRDSMRSILVRTRSAGDVHISEDQQFPRDCQLWSTNNNNDSWFTRRGQTRWWLQRLWIDTTSDDDNDDEQAVEMIPLITILSDPDPNQMERLEAPPLRALGQEEVPLVRDKNA